MHREKIPTILNYSIPHLGEGRGVSRGKCYYMQRTSTALGAAVGEAHWDGSRYGRVPQDIATTSRQHVGFHGAGTIHQTGHHSDAICNRM